MPKSFDACRKNGGKIRTKQLGNGKYMHVCVLGGKSYAGEVKSSDKKQESPVAQAIAGRMEK